MVEADIPHRSALDERIVGRRSPIHGRGLFARAPIAADEPVVRLGGQVVNERELLAADRPAPSLALGGSLVDYALHTGIESWEFACSCGARACRGVVTGRDWRRPDLRARYAGYFAPFIDERIHADG